jgi:putative restriction endonuclease
LAGEEPAAHQFVVALDTGQLIEWEALGAASSDLQRRYVLRTVAERVHQPVFRARVLAAYETRCAICRLRHSELLDAAHIQADADGGAPVVPNGIAMCKLHHAAYDENLLGIDADYRIAIRPDLLTETDGPTLRHSIQAVDRTTLEVPRQRAARPDRELLDQRFTEFRATF